MRQMLLFGAVVLIMSSCARPLAQFSVDQKSKEAPSKVYLKNQSKNAQTFQWDFGDGTNSEEENPSHVYNESGNYEVKLRASKNGKMSETTERVFVEAPEACLVTIETEFGNMVIELFNGTPKHRDNFLKLAGESYFDGLLFHRVINGFMIQGGDPNSKNAAPGQPLGTGGPGYTIPAEFTSKYVHIKGALAAARQPDQVNPEKASSGSQFYIVHGRGVSKAALEQVAAQRQIEYSPEQIAAYEKFGGTPHLDMLYTVFGRVIQGMEVIDKIGSQQVAPDNRPVKDVKMKILTIE